MGKESGKQLTWRAVRRAVGGRRRAWSLSDRKLVDGGKIGWLGLCHAQSGVFVACLHFPLSTWLLSKSGPSLLLGQHIADADFTLNRQQHNGDRVFLSRRFALFRAPVKRKMLAGLLQGQDSSTSSFDFAGLAVT